MPPFLPALADSASSRFRVIRSRLPGVERNTIHNVTPEHISNMRTRGMQNLSIDQLVSMHIHGID